MRSVLGLAATLACVWLSSGCGGSSGPSPRSGRAEETSVLPACDASSHPWTVMPPRADAELIYGTGIGDSFPAALERARTQAAATLETSVFSETVDTQVDWQRGNAAGKSADYESKFNSVAKTQVERRLQGCRPLAACRSPANDYRLLISCFKKSDLDRGLGESARAMASAAPKNAAVLLVPGTDEHGWITGLGEYASAVLRSELTTAEGGSPKLLRLDRWVPSDLAEVARSHAATHFLRVEHVAAGAQRVRMSVWLQDAATEKTVSRVSSFEASLDPTQLELFAIRGPLLPSKATMDLAGDLGVDRVKLQLAKQALREGDAVEFSFEVSERAYVYVFGLYEDGNAALLVPSPASPDNLFAAKVTHKLPDQNWKKRGEVLRACPLPGRLVTKEMIKIVASPSPLDLPGVENSSKEMATFESGAGTVANLVKRLNELKQQGARFSDNSVAYTISALPGSRSGCPK